MGRLFDRVNYIYQNRGFISLIRRTFTFFMSLILEYRKFYLYKRTLQERNEADFLPKIKNYLLKIFSTSQELDEIHKAGFDLSLLDIGQTKLRLNMGAILIIIFVGCEIGHRRWWALTEEAKNSFNKYPYKVDFSKEEACSGDAWTNPKYRRLYLDKYCGYESEVFLLRKGIKRTRAIVDTSNIASISGYKIRGGAGIYAKAWYLRILGLRFWKETPIN